MKYCHHCQQPLLTTPTFTPFDASITAAHHALEQLLLSSLKHEPASFVSYGAINELGQLEGSPEGHTAAELYELTEADYLAQHSVTLAWRARLLLQRIQSLPVDQQLMHLKGFLLEVGVGNATAERIYRLIQQQEPYTPLA